MTEEIKQAADMEDIKYSLSGIAASLEEIANSLQAITEAIGETSGRGYFRTLDIGREG
jgi:hypothetical protein